MEAARVALLGEALSRGVVAGSDAASAAAWVIGWAPSFRSGDAAQLVRVAHATRAARTTALAAAVLGARVGVRNAPHNPPTPAGPEGCPWARPPVSLGLQRQGRRGRR
jgi:hypothetical protein